MSPGDVVTLSGTFAEFVAMVNQVSWAMIFLGASGGVLVCQSVVFFVQWFRDWHLGRSLNRDFERVADDLDARCFIRSESHLSYACVEAATLCGLVEQLIEEPNRFDGDFSAFASHMRTLRLSHELTVEALDQAGVL